MKYFILVILYLVFSNSYATECDTRGNRFLPFGPLFSDYNRLHGYRYLGANLYQDNGLIKGASFRIWLPNAQSVELVIFYNGQEIAAHQMQKDYVTQIWGFKIDDAEEGIQYKYRIKDANGDTQYRNDPYSRFVYRDEATGLWYSVLYNQHRYRWRINNFIPATKLRIKEVHVGSVVPDKPHVSYIEMAEFLIPQLKRDNYNAISLLPIQHHNVVESWGYQPGALFSVNFRHGGPDEFKAMIDLFHENGIAVFTDYVPGHASKDWDTGLARIDGTEAYFHEDPRQGEHPEWGTRLYNYDRVEVRDFLLSNAIYWLDEFRVDGYRVDGVASMLYLDYSKQSGQWIPAHDGSNMNYPAINFLQALNREVHSFRPHAITIAEESSGYPGVTSEWGLGFDYMWRMGGMHHIRQFVADEPQHRNLFTIIEPTRWEERFVNYANSHDELAHGKTTYIAMIREQDPVQRYGIARNIELLNAVIYPGHPMNFQGDQFANPEGWNHTVSPRYELLQGGNFHDGFNRFMRELGVLYENEAVLGNHEAWSSHNLVVDNGRQILVQMRIDHLGEPQMIIIQNYSYRNYDEVYVPWPNGEKWKIVFNSDDSKYGGRAVSVTMGTLYNSPMFGSPYNQEIINLPAYSSIVLLRQ